MDAIGDRDSDLQMAATFGKMLLEKNEELQHELKHLQTIAEETTLENQCLTKQLAATKETVSQYSIQCSDLEDRLTEFQLVKSTLEKKIAQLELAMSNKTGEIKLLQIEMDDMRIKAACLEEENDALKKKGEEISELLIATTDIGKEREIAELKSRNKSLNNKIHSISKQKMKLETEITTMTDANRTLEQSLSETEVKLNKLQSKFDLLESEKQSVHVTSIDATSSYNASNQPPNKKKAEGATKNGVSLFGELDMEFLQLEKQFQALVTSCNCSASLPYRDKYLHHMTTGNHRTAELRKSSSSKKPFQHIFDKIYATLRETTIVADRLLLQTTMDTMDAENITEGVVS